MKENRKVNVADIVDDADRDIVEVLNNYCQGDLQMALCILTNSTGRLAQTIHRHPDTKDLREAGLTTEKIIGIVSGIITAYVQEDIGKLARVVGEIFNGTILVLTDEAELHQFKNP